MCDIWFAPDSCRSLLPLCSFPVILLSSLLPLSLATGRPPEPLAGCLSGGGRGSILLLAESNPTTWSQQCTIVEDLREGRCVCSVYIQNTACHTGWHSDIAVLHQCSSGRNHSWWIFTVWRGWIWNCSGSPGGKPWRCSFPPLKVVNQSLTQAAVKVNGSF